MITLGTNVKIIVSSSTRPQVRAFADAIGARLQAAGPTMDVCELDGGARMGFAYTDGALEASLLRLAPWIEIAAADPDALIARLDKLGLERVEYQDKTHAYFAGPGGFVFRVAPRPAN